MHTRTAHAAPRTATESTFHVSVTAARCMNDSRPGWGSPIDVRQASRIAGWRLMEDCTVICCCAIGIRRRARRDLVCR